MISKAWAVQGVGALLTVLSLHAHADVYGKTGDLDVGPAADITEQTVMCSDPDVLFKMYEVRPLKGDMAKFSEEFFSPYANKGICRVVPTSSAYLIGIRTAMIKRKDKDVASKYVLARVVVGGQRGYITPITLQQNGFDLIKAVSLENQKHGAPLMQ
ncbi:hypothetical protein [Pseudomonas nitroreducens]|uniref:hypothetical protein n=1 Tax=Pseudomonas nitroreducens TaxID=46680 RepID=UPI002659FC69|nr:hypothetical protein [Pseudomonas nitroreducens]MCP1649440.1 hypothetical protein [Pseudomonas nitroreducens]MCP1684599.1 hypothetical protein [Pseudomonas nitroreducens]